MIKSKLLLYLLAFCIVGYSGISFFSDQSNYQAMLFALLLLLYLRNPTAISTNAILFIGGFVFLMFIQSLIFKAISPYYYIRTTLFVFVTPLLFLQLMPENYNNYIVRLVFFWTIFTLLIWLATQVNPAFNLYMEMLPYQLNLDPFEGYKKSVIFFTYERVKAYDLNRFSGFWHEAGAFAVIMGYCLYANTLIKNRLFNKENLLFLVGYILTFSTTAFFALTLAINMYLFLFLKGKYFIKMTLFCLLLISAYYAYYNFDFLGKKLEEQASEQLSVELEGTPTSGRLLGFRKSLYRLMKYPIFGRGISSQLKEEDITSAESGGYGWPSYFSAMGIPMAILFSILFYRGMTFYARYYQADMRYVPVFFALFAVLLFSQKHTNTIIFFMLVFTPLVHSKTLKSS